MQADYTYVKAGIWMRLDDFGENATGKLVATVHDQKAFVPDPLPPALDLGAIALDLARAGQMLGELKGAYRRLNNPYILIGPLRRLEAQSSSAMEDTHTTADDLVLAEAGIEQGTTNDAREVANYVRALNWAVDELGRLPVSGRLLKGAHKILMQNVGPQRGQDTQPGEYARDQNMIGARALRDPAERLATARFIPPPPAEKAPSMAALETYMNRPDAGGATMLIDLALTHYQFETIHPFGDGNGRIGRMLISILPVATGDVDTPILYMSPELEDRKRDYIDLMYEVSTEGRWEAWLSFFLDTLCLSCDRTIRTIDRVLDLQQRYHQEAHGFSRSANIIRLIDLLFERPAVNAATVVREIGVTDAAARNLLRQLTEAGFLHESGLYYPTTWIAHEIVDIARP